MEVKNINRAALSWGILYSSKLSSNDKVVFCCLKDRVYQFDKTCTKPFLCIIDDMCNSLGLSRQTIEKSLKKLRDCGIIDVKRVNKYEKTQNEWTINWARIDKSKNRFQRKQVVYEEIDNLDMVIDTPQQTESAVIEESSVQAVAVAEPEGHPVDTSLSPEMEQEFDMIFADLNARQSPQPVPKMDIDAQIAQDELMMANEPTKEEYLEEHPEEAWLYDDVDYEYYAAKAREKEMANSQPQPEEDKPTEEPIEEPKAVEEAKPEAEAAPSDYKEEIAKYIDYLAEVTYDTKDYWDRHSEVFYKVAEICPNAQRRAIDKEINEQVFQKEVSKYINDIMQYTKDSDEYWNKIVAAYHSIKKTMPKQLKDDIIQEISRQIIKAQKERGILEEKVAMAA